MSQNNYAVIDDAPGAWREPVAPERVLRACRWLGEGECLRIQEISRSHRVFRIETDNGRSVIVKQLKRSTWETGRSLVREIYVYRLAAWIDDLAPILPKAFLIDERRQILVLEALPSEDHFTLDPALAVSAPGIASKLALAMATWHRKTANLALPAALAEGILWLPDALESAIRQRPASAQAFMRTLIEDPELTAVLKKARGLYRYRCLVHGDLKSDNWLTQDDGPMKRLKVIDWELSGAGDPAWDIASTCAEAILEIIRAQHELEWNDHGWPASAAAVLREFLLSYPSHDGCVDLHDPEERDRIVLFTVARLLHVASEWSDYQTNVDSGAVAEVVYAARRLLAGGDDASRVMYRWLAP